MVLPNFSPKNILECFCLQSTLDSEFFRGSVWAPTFFGHTKFEAKIFLEFFIYRVLWTEFITGASGPIFFGHAKFEVKNFLEFFGLYNTVDSEFIRGGVFPPTIFGHAKFVVKTFSEIFLLQSTLDSEFFIGGVFAPTFLDHAKYQVKNFLEFFHL